MNILYYSICENKISYDILTNKDNYNNSLFDANNKKIDDDIKSLQWNDIINSLRKSIF